jgi:hypothetical protein
MSDRTELINKARVALNLLPGVCQSIGKWELLASRCDMDSKLGKKRWKIRDDLLNQLDELKYDIRAALHFLE